MYIKIKYIDFAASIVFFESSRQLVDAKLGKEHATAGTTVSGGNKTPNPPHLQGLLPLARSEHREPLGLHFKIHRIFLSC